MFTFFEVLFRFIDSIPLWFWLVLVTFILALTISKIIKIVHLFNQSPTELIEAAELSLNSKLTKAQSFLGSGKAHK